MDLLKMPEEEMSDLLTEQRTSKQETRQTVVYVRLKLENLRQDNDYS